MGDMADYFVDRELDEGAWFRRRETPTCKQCGKSPLHWLQVNGKWRLFDPSGQPHSCRPAPREMFDDET